jgi:transposase
MGKQTEAGMQVIFGRVCGMDVHKTLIVACLRVLSPSGQVRTEIRKFGTMTSELLELLRWLKAERVTHVAMESTGVFWKPIYNILEGNVANVWVVNAQHLKKVPGRKSDVTDAQWIAQLLQCGLLTPSFVPDRTQRNLRDLTRQRMRLTQQRATIANRVHKTLEDANIKLGSVATDVMGVSGRNMIDAIIKGEEDSTVLAEMAQRRMRGKIPQLRLALEGKVTAHHRFLLKQLLEQYDYVEGKILAFNERIEQIAPALFQASAKLVDTVPGIGVESAQAILAEIGTNMGQFPSHKHLCSWAGRCPGNNESAGKHRSGKTKKANKWLDATLTEVAWAASRTKGTYLNAQYHRITPRRGRKRAIGALKHSMLTAIFFIVRDQVPYKDLGADHFRRLNPEQQTRYHVRKLKELGHAVELNPVEDAA